MHKSYKDIRSKYSKPVYGHEIAVVLTIIKVLLVVRFKKCKDVFVGKQVYFFNFGKLLTKINILHFINLYIFYILDIQKYLKYKTQAPTDAK